MQRTRDRFDCFKKPLQMECVEIYFGLFLDYPSQKNHIFNLSHFVMINQKTRISEAKMFRASPPLIYEQLCHII